MTLGFERSGFWVAQLCLVLAVSCSEDSSANPTGDDAALSDAAASADMPIDDMPTDAMPIDDVGPVDTSDFDLVAQTDSTPQADVVRDAIFGDDIPGDTTPIDTGPPTPIVPVLTEGWDWSMPEGATPVANSGFFSEDRSAPHHIDTRVVDVTWRQLEPTEGHYSRTTTGSAQEMSFDSLDDQLAASTGGYWLRIWVSSDDWAPDWVISDCGLSSIGTDYDGQDHLPIWDACFWGHVEDLYRQVFITWDLRNDPNLRFAYVPGAFTWTEFDFEMIDLAVQDHGLTFEFFNTWFQAAMTGLVDILNGENEDPSDDRAYKLVFTGEDFPFSEHFGTSDDLLARDAVAAGMGIRNGISELFNFHLSHIPAYGTTIASDGHMVTNEAWQLFDGDRVIATENECFNDCGFSTDDLDYVVLMANLKALQMRCNWLYLVPEDSYMDAYADLYEFIRLSLGHTAESSPDAWALLREFEDVYWTWDEAHDWDNSPWVHNFERWLVQRDVTPGGVSRRGSEVHSGELEEENGTSYEGRRTDHASGSDYLYFDLDDAFAQATSAPVDVVVTFLDSGNSRWSLQYQSATGLRASEPVENGNTGNLRTARFSLPDIQLTGALDSATDFRLYNGGDEDIEIRFVRVVR